MMAFAADDVADLRRWVMSGAIIVLAHGGIAAGMVRWQQAAEPAEPAASHCAGGVCRISQDVMAAHDAIEDEAGAGQGLNDSSAAQDW